MPSNSGSSFWHAPVTRLGWLAAGLAIAYMVMYVINNALFMSLPADIPWRRSLLPYYGILVMLTGLAAGIVGLVGLFRRHERSWLVWLATLHGVFVVIFLLGEFLIPH